MMTCRTDLNPSATVVFIVLVKRIIASLTNFNPYIPLIGAGKPMGFFSIFGYFFSQTTTTFGIPRIKAINNDNFPIPTVTLTKPISAIVNSVTKANNQKSAKFFTSNIFEFAHVINIQNDYQKSKHFIGHMLKL